MQQKQWPNKPTVTNASEKYYTRKAEQFIDEAFKTLWFYDTEQRAILRDSYMLNIADMNMHARVTHADLYDYYFRGIRKILLTLPGVRNFHRHEK